MRLVLASASPRRRELLQSAGIAFDVDPVDVDEQRWPEELPRQYVERVARAKAEAAQRKHPDRPVVAADTAVIVDGDVLGKPRDAGDAAGMLRRLAGRHHQVLTGLAVGFAGGLETDVEETTVWFTTMSDDDIASYVASGEPMDKAGAYAIQGLASRFISRIDGSYSNVVGLPVATLVQLLTRAGVPVNLS